MPRRAHISLTTKLASALLALGHVKYEHAKLMSAEQIISLYRFDHDPIPHALNGPDEPWNLTPRLIADHQHKTAVNNGTGRSDITAIARERRITRKRHSPKPKRAIARHVDPWGKKFRAKMRRKA